jgi:predicted glycogen debranching enzyme
MGTRYNIRVDKSDGLLFAGEAGGALTWMDAKLGNHAVTPRIGKPVEVNALWYNALVSMAQFARLLEMPPDNYEKQAGSARLSFQKFWNAAAGCCFDVIDSPGIREDASLRPNQIFCVSLGESPLTHEQQKAVVDICAKRLLTPYGLRSLAPGELRYHGRYEGAPRERDDAYHQGTVWGWLIGPFVRAHLRVYGQPAEAAALLEPFGAHIAAYGLGTLGEIFDGDAPFAPRGCIAQAWTVGEVLRAWHETALRK